jgi:hypothetical protein
MVCYSDAADCFCLATLPPTLCPIGTHTQRSLPGGNVEGHATNVSK